MPKKIIKAKKNSSSKSKKTISSIQKRDGNIVPFSMDRVEKAVFRAMQAAGEENEKDAKRVAQKVFDTLLFLKKDIQGEYIPHVEKIQDIVEQALIALSFPLTAKAYILYRQERTVVRQKIGFVPEKVKELVAESKKYFRNPLAELVYYRSYSKWIPEEGRRETWIETVDRYVHFMKQNIGSKLSEAEYSEVREAILKQEALPSMRLLQFAGRSAHRTNVCAYNCSFIVGRSSAPLQHLRV